MTPEVLALLAEIARLRAIIADDHQMDDLDESRWWCRCGISSDHEGTTHALHVASHIDGGTA